MSDWSHSQTQTQSSHTVSVSLIVTSPFVVVLPFFILLSFPSSSYSFPITSLITPFLSLVLFATLPFFPPCHHTLPISAKGTFKHYSFSPSFITSPIVLFSSFYFGWVNQPRTTHLQHTTYSLHRLVFLSSGLFLFLSRWQCSLSTHIFLVIAHLEKEMERGGGWKKLKNNTKDGGVG